MIYIADSGEDQGVLNDLDLEEPDVEGRAAASTLFRLGSPMNRAYHGL
jgi:hypothetical protein